MKIFIERDNSEREAPIITIDTKPCHYTYAIRGALSLAMELDGYDTSTIRDVFNLMPFEAKCEPQSDIAK